MRIGIFTDTYLPDINGVVSSIELLRQQLEALGHDVYVICTYPGMVKIKNEGKIIRLPGIEVKKLYGYALTTPIHYLFIDNLKNIGLDIIHAQTEFGVGIFANIVANQLHIPLVRTYHTTYEDYTHYVNFVHMDSVDKIAKKAISLLSKIFGDNCLELIAPSKKTKEMLVSYKIKTPISIIPTGIDLKRFSDDIPKETKAKIRQSVALKEDEKLLLYVGRIAQEKSLDLLIETFKVVRDRNWKLKLLIVGDGPQRTELENLCQAYDLTDTVFFAGKKPFTEVPAYYHSADAFISASTTETQGMTYIEALSSSLIVFARHDEVLEDLVKEGENGFLFNNKEELSKAFEKFMQIDDAKLANMKKAAQESASIYDAETFGKQVLNLYERAIANYSDHYLIESVTLKDDYVILQLSKNSTEEKTYISLNRYYDMGLRKGDHLSFDQYDAIKQHEAAVLGYRACIKRLAGRDYSIKEMYDYLNKHFELSMKDQNTIIDKLIEKDYLDDYRLAREKIRSYDNNDMAKNKMIRNLKKIGISNNIITELLINADDSQELDKAIKIATKYKNQIKDKSLNMKKQLIIQKLMREGFNIDDAKKAVGTLSFQEEIFMEEELLRKEALKAQQRYQKKYQGSELRNRVFHSLASKGFDIDAIYVILNEMEW